MLTVPVSTSRPRSGSLFTLQLKCRLLLGLWLKEVIQIGKHRQCYFECDSARSRLIQDHDYATVDEAAEVQLDRLQDIEVFVIIFISAKVVEVKGVELIGDKLSYAFSSRRLIVSIHFTDRHL